MWEWEESSLSVSETSSFSYILMVSQIYHVMASSKFMKCALMLATHTGKKWGWVFRSARALLFFISLMPSNQAVLKWIGRGKVIFLLLLLFCLLQLPINVATLFSDEHAKMLSFWEAWLVSNATRWIWVM